MATGTTNASIKPESPAKCLEELPIVKLFAATVALVPMLITSEVLAQATCTADTDCRPYETCMPGGTLDCPADGTPSCMPGESDEDCVARRNAWKAENCTETEGAHCKLHWLEPCDDAADCGEGFACDAEQCTAIETACTGDPDCPQYWVCISAASGSSDMDGGGGAPVDMVQVCIPPETGTGSTTNQAGSPTKGPTTRFDRRGAPLTSIDLLAGRSGVVRLLAGVAGRSPWYTRWRSAVTIDKDGTSQRGEGTIEFMDFE